MCECQERAYQKQRQMEFLAVVQKFLFEAILKTDVEELVHVTSDSLLNVARMRASKYESAVEALTAPPRK